MHTVHYDVVERYRQTNQGLVVPVTLRSSRNDEVRLEAKLDTGAGYCIFERQYGESIALDVEHGIPMKFSTVNGEFLAFGHEVTLIALGIELDGICYFYKDEAISKNVLGGIGWLNKVRVGADDTQSPGLIYAVQP